MFFLGSSSANASLLCLKVVVPDRKRGFPRECNGFTAGRPRSRLAPASLDPDPNRCGLARPVPLDKALGPEGPPWPPLLPALPLDPDPLLALCSGAGAGLRRLTTRLLPGGGRQPFLSNQSTHHLQYQALSDSPSRVSGDVGVTRSFGRLARSTSKDGSFCQQSSQNFA